MLKAKASEAATVAEVEVTTPEKADVKPPADAEKAEVNPPADAVVPVEVVDTTAEDEAPAVQVAAAEDVEIEVKETVDAAEETLVSSHDTVEPSASAESALHTTPAEEPIR